MTNIEELSPSVRAVRFWSWFSDPAARHAGSRYFGVAPFVQTVSVISLALPIVGCSGLKRNPVAHVALDPQHGYAIRIDFSYRSTGVCEFPPRTHKQTESAWIFVDTTNGVVAADQLTLWHGKSPQDNYGWAQKALLGSVIFTNGSMRVAFEVPDYRDDGSIRRHENYLWNGDYKLE